MQNLGTALADGSQPQKCGIICESAWKSEIFIMLYALSKGGKLLTPAKHHGKVKRLIRSGEARAVKRGLYATDCFSEDGAKQGKFFCVH
jgi:hypothetical protein